MREKVGDIWKYYGRKNAVISMVSVVERGGGRSGRVTRKSFWQEQMSQACNT